MDSQLYDNGRSWAGQDQSKKICRNCCRFDAMPAPDNHSWIRAAGKQETYQSVYYQLKRIGEQRKPLGKDINAYTIQKQAP